MELDFKKYSERDQRKIATAITNAITSSFKTNPCRFTQSEFVSRYDMCANLFHDMCYGEGWLLGRFCDTITKALSLKLDGQHFTGSKREAWVTEAQKVQISKEEYELNSSGLLVPKVTE